MDPKKEEAIIHSPQKKKRDRVLQLEKVST